MEEKEDKYYYAYRGMNSRNFTCIRVHQGQLEIKTKDENALLSLELNEGELIVKKDRDKGLTYTIKSITKEQWERLVRQI